MKIDNILKQYVSVRKALIDEKARLESRLEEINQVLGETPSVPAVPLEAVGRRRRVRGPMSMKAAVIKVTTGHPMTKPEIMAAIRELGYRSSSKKPTRMLDNVLYGRNPRFRNEDGRFSPIITGGRSAEMTQMAEATGRSRRRRMSAAGRARLSLLLRRRWAKVKRTGGRSLKARLV
jgi:hypothetical protein